MSLIDMMSKFIKKYKQFYPNEEEIINKVTYGRRKFFVISRMTKNEILQSFQDDKYFGNKLKKSYSKNELVKVLKRYSGFF